MHSDIQVLDVRQSPTHFRHLMFEHGQMLLGANEAISSRILFFLALICAIAVVGAVVWRLAAAARDVPRAERVGLIMTAVHDRASRDPAKTRARADDRDRTSTR